MLERVKDLLTLVHGVLSNNKQLIPRLPFTLEERAYSSPSSGPENATSLEGERRIAKIFDYNPDEYDTKTLLNRNFKTWTERPSQFLVQHQAWPCATHDPQYVVIIQCLRLQQTDAHSHILRRLYCVVLHRLRKNQCKNDNANTIAQSLCESLYPDEEWHDKQALTDSIEILIQAGSRYEHIASHLGIGSLFVLGSDIKPSV